MPSPTRKVQGKSAYKNNWRTRRNKQSGPQRNVSPLHPAHKTKSKKPVSKPLNSNSEGNPDY
jgi:hypothetical protein